MPSISHRDRQGGPASEGKRDPRVAEIPPQAATASASLPELRLSVKRLRPTHISIPELDGLNISPSVVRLLKDSALHDAWTTDGR